MTSHTTTNLLCFQVEKYFIDQVQLLQRANEAEWEYTNELQVLKLAMIEIIRKNKDILVLVLALRVAVGVYVWCRDGCWIYAYIKLFIETLGYIY